ncbi:MAG: hypothetical protein WKG06_12755 [Segetibacter sp.]
MTGENRLLVIAIDEYPKRRYERISNAKIDGLRFSKVLQEKYGFVLAREPILLHVPVRTGKILNHEELDALKSRWMFVSGGKTCK